MVIKNIRERVRNSDGTYDVLYKETSASLVKMNDGKSIENAIVSTLTHTKVGTVHNLTGTIPTTGIITAKFDVPTGMAYVEGDTFAINNIPYRALDTLGQPVSGFAEGATVPIGINVDTKLISFNGGGSGCGFMTKQEVLPASGRYNGVGTAWQELGYSAVGSYNSGIIRGNILYSFVSNSALIKRNMDDYSSSGDNYTAISGTTLDSMFLHNNELYVAGSKIASPNIHRCIYKLNESTKTLTFVSESSVNYQTIRSPMKIEQINATTFLFISSIWTGTISGNINITFYNFATGIWTNAITGTTSIDVYGGLTQKLPNGDTLIGIQMELTKLYVYQVNQTSLAIVKTGEIIIPSGVITYLQGIQLGQKIMYCTNVAINGKYTGEIDLINRTIDSSKYPDVFSAAIANNNLYQYQNEARLMQASKVNFLQLTATPPEQNAIVTVFEKGQFVNLWYGELLIDALTSPVQSAITLTTTPQIMTQKVEVHLGQYQANSLVQYTTGKR